MKHTPHAGQPREVIVETLRARILRGLQGATLRAGDRLPSARKLISEFAVDHRLIVAAYRQLASEGLVELRPRGGVYVAARQPGRPAFPQPHEAWVASVLAEGLNHEIAGPALSEWLRRCTETLRLRAVVVAATFDQSYGLCRELKDDFGFQSDKLLDDEVRGTSPLPLALRQADLIVAPGARAEWLHAVAAGLGIPLIAVRVRPDLRRGEWAVLLRRPVYAVVATREFGEMLRDFYSSVPGIENLHIIVFGEDDLASIPPDAAVYVTQRVRSLLGEVKLPGRVLPPARTISTDSARELFGFIVRRNMAAIARIGHGT